MEATDGKPHIPVKYDTSVFLLLFWASKWIWSCSCFGRKHAAMTAASSWDDATETARGHVHVRFLWYFYFTLGTFGQATLPLLGIPFFCGLWNGCANFKCQHEHGIAWHFGQYSGEFRVDAKCCRHDFWFVCAKFLWVRKCLMIPCFMCEECLKMQVVGAVGDW